MRKSRSRVPWIILAGFAGLVALLRPWTIRPIAGAARVFDAPAYVASIWNARVLPAADSSGVDIATFLASAPSVAPSGDAGGPKAAFVRGTAMVVETDRRSRVGLARIDVPGAKVAIQIGPVIRGTALRDALPFIRFTDFVNQLEFAEVSGALNDAVGTRVLTTVDVERLKGRTVTFVGAVATGVRPDREIEIVPVRLSVAGAAR
jgi:predicted lipoprotein